MSVKEALALIDRAIAQVSANRETHIALQQALAIVAAASDPISKPEPTTPPAVSPTT